MLILSCINQNEREQSEPSITYQREKGGFTRTIDWIADTTHSSIQFKTRHTAVHDVIGWIDQYEIKMTSSKYDFSDASIEAQANMRTIKMPNPGMAANLQNEKHFNTDSYPFAFFSSSVVYYDKTGLIIDGKMTIKGITRQMKMKGSFNGFAKPLLHGLPGFTIEGKFSRFDFNIGALDTLEGSTVPLIDDTIRFAANLRFYVDP